VAGVLNGLLAARATIDVPGGSLGVAWDGDTGHVTLSGPALPVYRAVLAQLPLLPR
jgi:diaminopimelate epimerase